MVQAHTPRTFPDPGEPACILTTARRSAAESLSQDFMEAVTRVMMRLHQLNALKVVSGEGVTVGPILLGIAKSAHIRRRPAPCGAVNMTLAAVNAGQSE